MKRISLIIGILLLIPLVCASNVDLNINKFSFSYGDELKVNVNIYNEFSNEREFNIMALMQSEDEDFVVKPESKTIKISGLKEKTIELYSFNIDEFFVRGNYNVGVDVYYENLKIGSGSINFLVREVLEDINLAIKICKDSSCKEESKIFIKNDKVYLNYASDINPEISAVLTYPDKTREEMVFPDSIKAEQIGTYELEITASKQGYKSITQTEQFGVIEKQADIKTVSFKEINYTFYILIGIVLILIITLIIVLYYYKKKKQSK